MQKEDFRKFIEDKYKENEPAPKFDWTKEKDSFITEVESFFSSVETFLKEFTETGKIALSKSFIEIEEPDTGIYEAPKLDIVIGNSNVTLQPIGTQLIGCKGRIDMKSRKGAIKIVLVSAEMKSLSDHISISITSSSDSSPKTNPIKPRKEITWQWKLLSAPPTSQYFEFNEDNFLEALMELANG